MRRPVVRYKNESEFNQAMKKAGAPRGPQKIVTHYTPTKSTPNVTEDKEHIGLEHHAERREQNQAIKNKAQNTPKEKLKRVVKKGAEKVKQGVDYAVPRIKSGAVRIAANAERSSGGRDSGFHISPPPDMFSFQAPSFMMGPMGPPEPARRRQKRRKPKKHSVGRKTPRQSGQGWQEIGAIPDSIKRWV
jgi:hypothetical protein